jgi:hypothetical protein
MSLKEDFLKLRSFRLVDSTPLYKVFSRRDLIPDEASKEYYYLTAHSGGYKGEKTIVFHEPGNDRKGYEVFWFDWKEVIDEASSSLFKSKYLQGIYIVRDSLDGLIGQVVSASVDGEKVLTAWSPEEKEIATLYQIGSPFSHKKWQARLPDGTDFAPFGEGSVVQPGWIYDFTADKDYRIDNRIALAFGELAHSILAIQNRPQ